MAKLFFSYSHHDEALRNELEVHLAMLKRQGVIEAWHDRRIDAGDDVHDRINQYLETADVVLLLVSPYFLASDYCYDREMTVALERHDAGHCRVIPVILHPCEWQQAPFGRLRATPADGKPVSKFANIHEAFLEVTKDIRAAIAGSPSPARTQSEPSQVPTRSPASESRTSNLRIKKSFSDRERDDFRHDAYEFIANFFAASLGELAARNPEIEGRFRPGGDVAFTAAVYVNGESRTGCRIQLDARGMMGDITYSMGLGPHHGINESMRVADDGYTLGLRPMGFATQGARRDELLSLQGAAEYFWTIFISSLQ